MEAPQILIVPHVLPHGYNEIDFYSAYRTAFATPDPSYVYSEGGVRVLSPQEQPQPGVHVPVPTETFSQWFHWPYGQAPPTFLLEHHQQSFLSAHFDPIHPRPLPAIFVPYGSAIVSMPAAVELIDQFCEEARRLPSMAAGRLHGLPHSAKTQRFIYQNNVAPEVYAHWIKRSCDARGAEPMESGRRGCTGFKLVTAEDFNAVIGSVYATFPSTDRVIAPLGNVQSYWAPTPDVKYRHLSGNGGIDANMLVVHADVPVYVLRRARLQLLRALRNGAGAVIGREPVVDNDGLPATCDCYLVIRFDESKTTKEVLGARCDILLPQDERSTDREAMDVDSDGDNQAPPPPPPLSGDDPVVLFKAKMDYGWIPCSSVQSVRPIEIAYFTGSHQLRFSFPTKEINEGAGVVGGDI